MSEITEKLANLSPEQLRIFQLKLKQRHQEKADFSSIPVSPLRGTARDWSLSFAQERLWFLSQMERGNPFYNMAAAIRLLGPLHIDVLEHCLNEVIQRHENLRTTFISIEGQPRQVIAEQLTLSISICDLCAEPREQREQAAYQQTRSLTRQPFDLEHGPLLRANLFCLEEQEHVLVLTMHHLIMDGWSIGVLMREMSTLYVAFVQGRPSPLSPLPLQYADYAAWQRDWLRGEVLEQQLAYWKARLEHAPALLDLPVDHLRPPTQSYRGARAAVNLPSSLYSMLKAFCQQEGVTPFMVLLAAWALLLGRWSTQEDLLIGTPIAGRSRRELEPLLGLFTNTLALRIDLSGEPTFRQLVQRVREVALGAYAHQDLPFEKLVEALAPNRDPSHQPLFNTVFILQNTPIDAALLPELHLQPVILDSQTAKYDLELSLIETAQGKIEGYLEYSSELFEHTTILHLLEQYQLLLTQALTHPELSHAPQPLAAHHPPAATSLARHGYRLWPTLLQAHLCRLPGVQQAHVLLHDATLAAYVVPQPGAPLSEATLQEQMRAILPRYQVPDAFVLLPELPRTADGTIDQPELLRHLPDVQPAPQEPRSELEQRLVVIWQEVLQVEGVGLQDNFFELGGHSLLATQVVARLEEELGEQLGGEPAEREGLLISAMFEEPTIGGLARRLEQWEGQPGQEPGSEAALQAVERGGLLPLSFTQERLWFLDQLEPGNPFYNIVAAVRLTGPFNIQALEYSLHEVAHRHESLRTTFVSFGGQPQQVIAEQAALSLSLIDLGEAREEEREQLAYQRALEEAQCPFDLAHGPLLRALLIRLDEQEFVLVFNMHHIISDGWSMGVLIRELSYFYGVYVEDHAASPLPPLPIQYADYAVWQRQWLQGEVLEQQLNYWKEQLQHAPTLLDLPSDHPRPPIQSYRGAKEDVHLPGKLMQDLKAFCQQEGVTPFMVLLAAWALLLGRWSAQEDLLIGTPIAGRKRRELEPLIGFFVNTLVLRVKPTPQCSFRQLVQQVRETALGAYAHQDLPFEKLVEVLAPERDLSHQPLFQVMFILQNMPSVTPDLPGVRLAPVVVDNQTAKYDLELSLVETFGEQMEGYLEYSTDLFAAETIHCLWQQYQLLLEAALSDPERCIEDIELDILFKRLRHTDLFVSHRGYRLSPSEIERYLCALADVQQARVSIRDNEEGSLQVVAYIILQPGRPLNANSLRKALRERMPRYKIPDHFVILDELPLTPEGKVDDETLARIGIPAIAVQQDDATPTPLEEQLIAIWREVLQVEQMGIQDNFFELGGHSLLATQIIARIQETFAPVLGGDGAELEGILISTLFEEPTIAALAAQLQELLQPEGQELAAPPLQPVGREQALPLSLTQERLWFLDQLEPGNPFYNIVAAVRLRGVLQVELLERSLNQVVQRHESLRTTFASVEGVPYQVIAERLIQPLSILNVSEEPREQREELAYQHARTFVQQPFDLAHGPLVRALLIQLEEHEFVFVLSLHHIIVDGWSMGVLFSELASHYQAAVEDRIPLLPTLPVQYADYALWQRHWLQGETLEAHLAYWKAALQDAPPQLDLPTDHPRPAVQSHRGAREAVTLSAEVSQLLKTFCQQEGVTPFMVLLAAWALLLGRWSEQEDLLIGTPIAGRKRRELEPLIGFFVNTLVLRVKLTPQCSFRQLVQQVREMALGAYAHQDLPFEKLVETLAPERDLSHQPLFQVMFILQNTPASPITLPDLEMQPLQLDSATAKFDLTLELTEIQKSFEGWLEYSTDLFEPATIRRLARQFLQLLTEALAAPHQFISTISLLAAEERRQVLSEWNQTTVALPEPAHLVALFEAQVRRTPQALALVESADPTRQLSYAQLNAQANRLAHWLRCQGIGPQDCVALCLPRGCPLVVAILAVLKTGAYYLPLEPSTPAARLHWLLHDAHARLLLAHSQAAPSLTEEDTVPLCWLDRWQAEEDEPTQDPAAASQNLEESIWPEQGAYLIYTSGSTGTPKGVLGTHRGLVNRLGWQWRCFPYQPEEVCCHKTSLHFVDALAELFAPLLAGIPTVLVAADPATDLPAFLALLAHWQVSRLVLVPSLLRLLLEQESALGARLPRLHTWVSSGEALPVELVRRFQQTLPGARLLNLYGSSEVSADVSAYRLPADLPATEPRVPVGRPLDNTRLYVLDQQGEPVSVGMVGEVYVGGAGLAQGYVGQAALTAERFLPDPFSGEEGARLYRTGDVGRYRADGRLEVLGRHDQQVKLRGVRIEVGEIEEQLRGVAGVREVVVVPWQVQAEDVRLVAYVVRPGEQEPTEAPLRLRLRSQLPASHQVSHYVWLERLPQTASGKVDRAGLPAPVLQGSGGTGPGEAPRTPLEEQVAAIWQQVLGVEQVGRASNFFEQGGHSLLATRVLAQVRQQVGVELAVRSLFETDTLASFAALIMQHMTSAQGQVALPPLQPARRDGALLLSFAQERMWFLDQLEPGNPFYTIMAALRLYGPLNIQALRASVQALVQRHESLRTTFVSVEGVPCQVIAELVHVEVPLRDLRALPAQQREAQAREQTLLLARRPFDLAHGPLLRALLIQLEEHEFVLVLSLHHIIADGWSMGVLFSELASYYQAAAENRTPSLPSLPVQYADYALWQRHWLQGEALEAHLAYWKTALQDAPPQLDLPIDHPRPAVQSYQGAREPFQLSPELTRQLQQLCQQEGVTPFMMLLAAWALLLSRLSGQNDLLVGTPIAGRRQAELEPLIGLFINTLVMRVDLSGQPSFHRLLHRVREMALGAYTHQDLPFEKLVDELAPERDLSRPPLFQTMLILQNTPLPRLSLSELRAELVTMDGGMTQFDLVLEVAHHDQGFSGHLEYNTDLFEANTIRRFLHQFQHVLESVLTYPQQSITQVSLLTADEQKHVLHDWNAKHLALPASGNLVQLFETQVQRAPQAIAVCDDREQLSYQQLHRQANQLAHYLRRQGVEPEARVCVCLERSCLLVVAILAVLKAGGTYVPVDVNTPAGRLDYLLDDTQTVLLLTQSDMLERIGNVSAAVLPIDREENWRQEAAEENLNAVISSRQAAYIVYTSGSTGRPKGVIVEHQSIVNAYYAWEEAYALSATTTHLQMANVAFDVFSGDLVRALCSGRKLVFCPRSILLEPEQLYAFMRRHTIDCAEFVPAVIRPLMEYLERTGQDLHFMRLLAVGSDMWSMQEYRQLQRLGGPALRLVNSYGLCEATIDSTYFEDNGKDTYRSDLPAPIGRPFANTRIYVLDQEGQPVPVGVIGEIYIGGPGVARGYLGQPDLTAERFVPDPFSGEESARLYRTGDLARYRSDGVLEFIGRRDQQVKVRGQRIELGEIEAVLAQLDTIQDCAVTLLQPHEGDTRLVAYVVASSGQVLDDTALRKALEAHLPTYMIPNAFVQLDALPLSANGKVDRKALAKLYKPLQPAAARKAPTSELEHKLVGIWQNILGIEPIGVQDNFFALGGHSLLVPQMMTRVRQAVGMDVPLRVLFEAPTIEELAHAIHTARQQGERAVEIASAPVDLRAEAVLDPAITAAQKPIIAATRPGAIFLTGATGFLGAYLLDELLRRTEADIYCLVRASNIEDARRKLRQNLAKYQLESPASATRVIPIVGDLGQPLLGLEEKQFTALTEQIDCIYHCGAWVNFTYPYRMLRAVNVLGTQEILRLASQHRVKPVHYISTLDVFSSRRYKQRTAFHEDEMPQYCEELSDGYAESKWVAEQLVAQARSRGIPVTIYRPGLVGGHSRTGINISNELIWRLVKGCIQLGYVPDAVHVATDLVPVDYVSAAIVVLSQREQSRGKNFHLCNAQPPAWKKLAQWIESFGYPVVRVSYIQWRRDLLAALDQTPDHVLSPFPALFPPVPPSKRFFTSRQKQPFDTRNAAAALQESGILCPSVDERLFHTYLEAFVRSGFLKVPPQRAAIIAQSPDKEARYRQSSPGQWVLSHLLQYRYTLTGFVLGTVLYNILTASIPMLLGEAFNVVTQAGSQVVARLLTIALIILGVVLLRGLVGLGSTFAIEVLAERVERDTRDELYKSLMSKSQTFHNRQRIGDLMAVVTNDVKQLNAMVNPGIDLIFDAFMNLLIPLFFIAFLQPALLLTPLLFIIVFAVSLQLFSNRIGPVSVQLRRQFGKMNASLMETILGIEVVQSAAREEQEQARFHEQARQYRDLFAQNGRLQGRYLPPLLLVLALIGAFLHGIFLLTHGQLSIGSLVSYLSLIVLLRYPTSISLFSFVLVQLGLASAGRILRLMRDEAEIDERQAGQDSLIQGELIFENVTFGYGDTAVLKNISFRAAPGQTIAIVGQTGSGKSTLARLVNRTYDASAGRILVDGVDIRRWDLASLRRQIATIEQDVFLFSKTIAQNIIFGLEGDVTPDVVERVAQEAQAHEFITSFRDGYNTVIGERGVTLSGGQRQRIAIARALLVNPRILLLDDATNAIDSATEDTIQQAIRRLQRGRTTLLITNRLSQIRQADKILVLQGGRLVDQGTHEELLSRCDLYQRIFARYRQLSSVQV